MKTTSIETARCIGVVEAETPTKQKESAQLLAPCTEHASPEAIAALVIEMASEQRKVARVLRQSEEATLAKADRDQVENIRRAGRDTFLSGLTQGLAAMGEAGTTFGGALVKNAELKRVVTSTVTSTAEQATSTARLRLDVTTDSLKATGQGTTAAGRVMSAYFDARAGNAHAAQTDAEQRARALGRRLDDARALDQDARDLLSAGMNAAREYVRMAAEERQAAIFRA